MDFHPYQRRRTQAPNFPFPTHLRRSPSLKAYLPLSALPSLPRISELDAIPPPSESQLPSISTWSNPPAASDSRTPQFHWSPPFFAVVPQATSTTPATHSTHQAVSATDRQALRLAPIAIPPRSPILPNSAPPISQETSRMSNEKLASLRSNQEVHHVDDKKLSSLRSKKAVSEEKELGAWEARKLLRLPPSGCGVCATTETTEWRKGPAGIRSLCNACGLTAAKRVKEQELKGDRPPNTLALIEKELKAIGSERFKPPNGRYQLPEGFRRRISEAQRRTKAHQSFTNISAPFTNEDRSAAGVLVTIARRASEGNPPPSSASSSRSKGKELRRKSLEQPGHNRAPRFLPNITQDLPPSSSYMPPAALPSRPSAPSAVPPNSSTHFYSSQHHYNAIQRVVPYMRSRIDGAVYPHPPVSTPRFVPSLHSSIPPTASLNKMSLSRLTEPSYPLPHPAVETRSHAGSGSSSESRKTSI